MTGQELPAVLHPGLPFQKRFEKVAFDAQGEHDQKDEEAPSAVEITPIGRDRQKQHAIVERHGNRRTERAFPRFPGTDVRGELVTSPADISFHEDMLVQPDLFVVPIGPDGRRGSNWTDIRALLLAVEILSPTTARADRQAKRQLYQRERVGEYWIVDLDARVVERWRPDDDRPEIITGTLTWHSTPDATSFTLDLVPFFEAVLGDR